MKRINLFEIYRAGAALSALKKLTPQTKVSDVMIDLANARLFLDWMLAHEHFPIKDNRDEAELVVNSLQRLINLPDGTVGAESGILRHVFSNFEVKLSVEWGRLHVYAITPIMGYDSDVLLSSGRAILAQSTLKWLPENAAVGFDEGTRSLALKQATAAGFLLLRSVEDMMHHYYDALSNRAPRPSRRCMGDYIDALEKVPSVSPTMLDVLRGIKNLRRNPLMHPEHRLKMDDAIETFDVAKSAISAMARLAAEHAAQTSP